MHVIRIVRRRYREARYLGLRVRPFTPIRWAVDEIVEDFRSLAGLGR